MYLLSPVDKSLLPFKITLIDYSNVFHSSFSLSFSLSAHLILVYVCCFNLQDLAIDFFLFLLMETPSNTSSVVIKPGGARCRDWRVKMNLAVLVIRFFPLSWPMILVHMRNGFSLLVESLSSSELVLNLSLHGRKLKLLEKSSSNHSPEHKMKLKLLKEIDRLTSGQVDFNPVNVLMPTHFKWLATYSHIATCALKS